MTQLTSIATLFLLAVLTGTSNANEQTNRDFRCFWENAGGCTNTAPYRYGNCEWFCVERGCNLSQRDFCAEQGFPARRRLEDWGMEEGEFYDHQDGDQEDPFTKGMTSINPADIPHECYTEGYEMNLMVVEGHLVLTALPGDIHSTTCPSLVAQTTFRNDHGDFAPTKHLTTVGSQIVEQVSYPRLLVTFLELQDFLSAFEAAVVSTNEEDYDMMGNNCSVFIQSMLLLLGLDLTPEIEAFVVDGLMQSDSMMQNIQETMAEQGFRGRMLRYLMSERDMATYVVEQNIQSFNSWIENKHNL